MRFFVIGLGSMGKRRVRCLLELGYRPDEIYGFDNRGDRRVETVNRYGIRVIDTMEGFNFRSVDAFIVSLPPDKHKIGVDIAVKYQKPVFVEASVILSETELIREVGKDIFIAPSCTFVFHPMIKEIKRIVNSEKYGKVCNFSYHSGQYLPDWHPWEDVKDFYVSNRLTGGAREIVPYELTWITDSVFKVLTRYSRFVCSRNWSLLESQTKYFNSKSIRFAKIFSEDHPGPGR